MTYIVKAYLILILSLVKNVETYSLHAHLSRFSSEQMCHDYLVKTRWNGKPQCPKCENNQMNYYLSARRIYKCSKCRTQFSVTKGTIFEKSKVPLSKWFIAIYLLVINKRGISSYQLSKMIGVKQHTAWFMLHRLREALKNENEIILNGIVEVDETFVSPKIGRDKRLQTAKRKHEYEQDKLVGYSKYKNGKIGKVEGYRKRGRKKGSTKEVLEQKKIERGGIPYSSKPNRVPYEKGIIVLGMLERGGRMVIKKLGINGKSVTKANIYPILKNQITEHSTLITDQLGVYDDTKYLFAEHLTVNHEIGYVVDGIHTNGIENCWKHLKKTIDSTYFHISYAHFDRYSNEISYRWNRRNLSEQTLFEDFFHSSLKEKITYNELKIKKENKLAA